MKTLEQRNRTYFGLGTVGRDMFYSFEANTILFFLTDVLSLPVWVFAATSMMLSVLRIFDALNIEGQSGLDVISCPTCGRTKIDLIPIVAEFEKTAEREGLLRLPLKVAIMGCVVNGPGEAREADIGVAGGKGEAVLIKKGEIIRKIPEDDIVSTLIFEIKKMTEQK